MSLASLQDSGPVDRYVLITPARNEEQFIEGTIRSVVSQTVVPTKWIIVSDGSTDRTEEIVNEYVDKVGFIQLLHVKGDRERNFGSKGRAFQKGYEILQRADGYEYIGNLDADVSFGPDYFARLLSKFRENPRLGVGGGYLHEERNGVFRERSGNRVGSVPNAVQLFRRECYEEIGGFIVMKYGAEDWYADVKARSLGWGVRSFTDLVVMHHRPTSSAGSPLRTGFRHGRGDYALGSSPLFEVVKCVSMTRNARSVFYAANRFCGYLWSNIIREDRPVSKEFVRYIRREQLEKLKKAFVARDKGRM